MDVRWWLGRELKQTRRRVAWSSICVKASSTLEAHSLCKKAVFHAKGSQEKCLSPQVLRPHLSPYSLWDSWRTTNLLFRLIPSLLLLSAIHSFSRSCCSHLNSHTVSFSSTLVIHWGWHLLFCWAHLSPLSRFILFSHFHPDSSSLLNTIVSLVSTLAYSHRFHRLSRLAPPFGFYKCSCISSTLPLMNTHQRVSKVSLCL